MGCLKTAGIERQKTIHGQGDTMTQIQIPCEHTITESFIKILFSEHSIFIDLTNNALYLDGDPVVIEGRGESSNPLYKNKNNRTLYTKKRIRTVLTKDHHVMTISKGDDGRLFFHLFDELSYKMFRGKPVKTYSFEATSDIQIFYEDDLRKPLWYRLMNIKKPSAAQ